MKNQNIKHIVLTGGPCAGKSTIIHEIKQWLTGMGIAALAVPETATEIFTAGLMEVPGMDVGSFQKNLMGLQNSKELDYQKIAQSIDQDLTVVIYDRGFMDTLVYSGPNVFAKWLEENSLSKVEVRDIRYDGVIHLRSAAVGAEDFYIKESNSARLERVEDASEADEKTLKAWIGAPHLRIVSNSGSFVQKIEDTKKYVLDILGIPEPIEIERKYLISNNSEMPEGTSVQIHQYYLDHPKEGRIRLRRRGEGENWLYTLTQKQKVEDGVYIENEHRLENDVFERLMGESRMIRSLVKERRCFVFDDQYFELDYFPDHDLYVMEIELLDIKQSVSLPPFLTIEREVTGDGDYMSFSLAKSV